ncbi:DUF2339 domain-containing protein [Granulicella sp. WH15]|uniref:DUF2339 domain-containing protein n=1 Tax=Granulicella sp. WH15 TaxID=2602070 RepID=UPI001366A39E|nr:DUF2339 domain-containing protein [Granulicella sp. WH15]QHN02503.1 DUF2339 domain-containing protein [Granulicella sp. WH15]
MAPQHPQPEQPSQPEAPSEASVLADLTARVESLERQLAELRQQPVSLRPSASLPIKPVAAPAPPLELPPPPPKQSLENRLGSQVFSRVGIIALLVGTTWFLKWAIDNQWIGQTGRVLIGLLAGAALILWSERFRRTGFSAFSYTLKAVGSGALYLSLWAAFQLYHLLPAPVALAAMLLVTAWNAWMAWAQDAELLAAYALIGAFATPVLLSTGGNNELFLFAYLAATDLATVALVRLKPWPRLLVPAFAATVVYFTGWYIQFFSPTVTAAQDQLPTTLIFLGLFFALFAAASITSKPNLARHSPVILEIALPLANALFTALAAYAVLDGSGHHALLPWAAVLLAATYLGLMRLHKTAAAAAVHLSLAIAFLTIAIPLKASGRWITIGWLVEGTALLWSASRLASAAQLTYQALRLLALAALALGFCGLVSLPFWLFGQVPTAFFNDRFATSLVGIAAFAFCVFIARTAAPEPFWTRTAIAGTLALNLAALQSGVTEIVTFWHTTTGLERALKSDLSISFFLAGYGAALLAIGFWRRSAFLRWQALALIVFTIAKVFLYDVSGLSQGYRVASFLGLGALLLAVSFAYQKNLLGLREAPQPTHAEEAQP